MGSNESRPTQIGLAFSGQLGSAVAVPYSFLLMPKDVVTDNQRLSPLVGRQTRIISQKLMSKFGNTQLLGPRSATVEIYSIFLESVGSLGEDPVLQATFFLMTASEQKLILASTLSGDDLPEKT